MNIGSPVTIRLRDFGGPFLTGTFTLKAGSRPGAVVIDIDFDDRADRSGRVTAEVREGWLKAMAAGATTRSEAAAAVAAALTELAAIPSQRTVQRVTYRRSA